jgi:hypothetical protein
VSPAVTCRETVAPSALDCGPGLVTVGGWFGPPMPPETVAVAVPLPLLPASLMVRRTE